MNQKIRRLLKYIMLPLFSISIFFNSLQFIGLNNIREELSIKNNKIDSLNSKIKLQNIELQKFYKIMNGEFVFKAEDRRNKDLFMLYTIDTSDVNNSYLILTNYKTNADSIRLMTNITSKRKIPVMYPLMTAHIETRFNPNVVSKTNDGGKLQINKMMATRMGYRFKDLKNITVCSNAFADFYYLIWENEKHKYGDKFNIFYLYYNRGDIKAKEILNNPYWKEYYMKKF